MLPPYIKVRLIFAGEPVRRIVFYHLPTPVFPVVPKC